MPGILSDAYLDAIKGFEGYQPKASWDYAQFTNGYGTRAAHPGETIDKNTAEQRFQSEIGKAAGAVDAAFPQLPEGARAALTSLTFNAGPGWINGGLGKAVRTGDWTNARNLFQQYNHAGGQVLPGLVNRRAQEGAWLVGAQGPQPMNAQSVGAQSTPGAPLFAGGPQNTSGGVTPEPGQPQANPFAGMTQLGLNMMQPSTQPDTVPSLPAMRPFAQLQRPQVDYSGLQAFLSGRHLTPLA